MGMVSDDAFVAGGVYTWATRWEYAFYENGRIFTDMLAYALYFIPFWLWKVLDSVVYCLLAKLFTDYFTEGSIRELLQVMVLLLLFPMDYLSSAGYIATSSNYVYTMVAVLMAILPLVRKLKSEKVTVWHYSVMVLGILYACNQDQYAVVLLAGLGLYVVYACWTKQSTEVLRQATIELIICIVVYAMMLCLPGHVARMQNTGEMEYWLPQYAQWSLWEKLLRGYTTTVANIIFYQVDLFLAFCVELFCLSMLSVKKLDKIIAACPIFVVLVTKVIGSDKFVVIAPYSCGMPDLGELNHDLNMNSLGLSVLVIGCIVYLLCSQLHGKTKFLCLGGILLAAGSREMMGFSATIYASSFRTFTIFLYIITAMNIVLLNVVDHKSQVNKRCFYFLLQGVLLGLAIC